MTANSTLKAKIVRVEVERGSAGAFFATSPDLKGLFVVAKKEADLEERVRAAITGLYAACGVKVVVSQADDGLESKYTPWVAMPADLAEKVLRAQ